MLFLLNKHVITFNYLVYFPNTFKHAKRIKNKQTKKDSDYHRQRPFDPRPYF